MAKFFTAHQIEAALQRLAASRAKARLHDFLVVKTTFVLKGTTPVAIAQSEPAFMKALDDFSATGLPLEPQDDSYFNPVEGAPGYRPIKYRSNGPNSTIGGNAWRPLIHLTDDKPRRSELADGYEAKLESFFLSSDKAKAKPAILDYATWLFRSSDLAEITAANTLAEAAPDLVAAFKDVVGLTETEAAALFVKDLPVGQDGGFVGEKATPESYLPPRSAKKQTTGSGTAKIELWQTSEGGGMCSLELVTALAAKPFVILSGPSGTGKSRAALKLAEAVQASLGGALEWPLFALVPVGPDWTNPRRLLGHRTPFGATRTLADGGETNDSYEITEPLRIMLRALHPEATGVPHFLILDEMNLSHVERYFAPFLSLMEASTILESENAPALLDQDSLRVLSEVLQAVEPDSPEAKAAALLVQNGSPFVLPSNLLIVGTVNVDDTTYMFSPKVMDRAHVIELQAKAPMGYLAGTTDDDASLVGGVTAAHLLKLGIDAREDRRFAGANPSTYLAALIAEIGVSGESIEQINATAAKALEGSFQLLAPIGFQFGYRTVKEVYQYLYYWGRTAHARSELPTTPAVDWLEGLDNALLQKVLPKLHGNRRSLLGALPALAAFFDGCDNQSKPMASYALGSGELIEIQADGKLAGVSLSRSRQKLLDMERRLAGLGYVSFVA